MDTNRIIKIDEMEVGDEILVASNGLRYYRILRKPRINPKTGKYSGVKCSMNAKKTTTRINIGTKWERNITHVQYICTPEGHNTEKMIYGFHRDCWLIKKGGNV